MKTCARAALAILAAACCTDFAAAQTPRRVPPEMLRYTEPQPTEAPKQLTESSLKKEQKERVAELLATLAANNIGYTQPGDYRLASRILGLGMCIAPDHRQIMIANGALTRDKKPNIISNNLGRKEILKELMDNATALSKNDSAADKLVSAHLLELIIGIDSTNEDALYLAEVLRKKDVKSDWAFTEGKKVAREQDPNKANAANVVTTLAKDQSTIKSMVIMRAADGTMNGIACDVIATKNVDEANIIGYPPGQARFVKPVGEQMQTSLDEAVRLIKLRKNAWKPAVMISFEDKYTGHDGGSAGTAFTVLIRSMMEGFDIDTTFAITGDVTVDGKVRKIGGVGAKLRGAAVDKCKYAAIPAENSEIMSDVILIYGERLLWDLQIFSIATTDDAVGLLRKDRAKEIESAMTLFAEVQADLKKIEMLNAVTRKQFAEDRAREKLQKVLTLAPNHLSAKHILQILDGKKVTKLTATASVYHGMSIAYPVLEYLSGMREGISPKDVESMKQRLAKLTTMADKEALPLIKSLNEVTDAAFRLSYSTGGPQIKQQLYQTLKDKSENVRAELDALRKKSDVAEKMMREGV